MTQTVQNMLAIAAIFGFLTLVAAVAYLIERATDRTRLIVWSPDSPYTEVYRNASAAERAAEELTETLEVAFQVQVEAGR